MLEQLQEAINSDGQNLKLTDLDALLEMIDRKRHDMEQQEKENSLELLLHFLNHFRFSSNTPRAGNHIQEQKSFHWYFAAKQNF